MVQISQSPKGRKHLAEVGEPNTSSVQLSEDTTPTEASAAMRALADLFANSKGPGGYRQYLLERIDGELVFRQTEFDAVFEAVPAELFGLPRARYRRRIIKLP
jgi:hypothetical protein